MVDQVKLNDAGMICHLMKVSSWSHDAALFPVSFYPTKSVDSKLYLHMAVHAMSSSDIKAFCSAYSTSLKWKV